MTISGWVLFAIFVCFISVGGFAAFMWADDEGSKIGKVLSVVITGALITAMLYGMLWFYDNTAMGQRALVDQKSNLNNGLERTITVYTADGEVIAHYSGLIDIATSEGGYIKFDFEGKRYIYYNCFVESVAEIE